MRVIQEEAQTFKNNNHSSKKKKKKLCGYEYVAPEILSPLLYEPDI